MQLKPLAAALTAIGLLLFATSPANGHADTSNTPENGAVLKTAPAQVAMNFSEPMTGASAKLLALKPGSTAVKTSWSTKPTATRSLSGKSPRKAGVYALIWNGVATDGDSQSGILTYQVGNVGKAKPATRRATVGAAKVTLKVSDTRPGSMARVQISVAGGSISGGYITIAGYEGYPIAVGKATSVVLPRLATATMKLLVTPTGGKGEAVSIVI